MVKHVIKAKRTTASASGQGPWPISFSKPQSLLPWLLTPHCANLPIKPPGLTALPDPPAPTSRHFNALPSGHTLLSKPGESSENMKDE